MRAVAMVALDILREATARKWFVALGAVLTLLILGMSFALRLEVVDGALAATRLFGQPMRTDIRPAIVALEPLYLASTYVTFYGGLIFGILACSDFGPELLAPGRVEHLLSLPLRRVELLLGTFLGVMLLCLACTFYGTGGFLLVLSVKSGIFTLRPFLAALLSAVPFSAIYAAMLATTIFVRSPPLSAAVGGFLFVLGIVAGYREGISQLFHAGFSRWLFLILTAPLPRVSELATLSASIAVGGPIDPIGLFRLTLGTLTFGMALLAVGAWHLETKDF